MAEKGKIDGRLEAIRGYQVPNIPPNASSTYKETKSATFTWQRTQQQNKKN